MWRVVGQTRAVSFLQRSLERGSLSHAYLLVGPAHVGKMTLALDLAQGLNCEAAERPCGECLSCQKIAQGKHADVQVISLAPKDSGEAKPRAEISIEQIRELQHAANLPPFEGKSKVFIIDGADFLSTEAANCLLKTLEEPPGKVVFILLTTNERLLPATVVSRCQRLELFAVPAKEMEAALVSRWNVEPQKARLLARLSHGCFGWAVAAALDDSLLQQRNERLNELLDIIKADTEERFAYAARLATQFGQNRALVQDALSLWLDWWRDLMLVKTGNSDIITNVDRLAILVDMAKGCSLAQIRAFIGNIEAAGERLKRNANPRLVLEVLMLNIPEVHQKESPVAKSR
ncbi:MAG: AAA family ATPase [Chloroflexi bacterium]|nr:AAA family ATPase [Chloroflexota bacterium]